MWFCAFSVALLMSKDRLCVTKYTRTTNCNRYTEYLPTYQTVYAETLGVRFSLGLIKN